MKVADEKVIFSYRDRAAGDIKKVMSLPIKEFLSRFKQHILPRGFVKIRHYGRFSTRAKKEKLASVRKALGEKQKERKKKRSLAEVILETAQDNIHRCKSCRQGTMVVIRVLPRVRGSPSGIWTRQKHK